MKTAKLFQNGQSQAVRLPKDFRVEGTEVFIKKMGRVIILLPMDNPWEPLLNSLDQFSADFMETRTQPSQQTREDFE
jgi:antitoxin VapB